MTFHDSGNDEAINTLLQSAPQWRRSSYCANGACVEIAVAPAAPGWRKSSHSSEANCVEVATGPDVLVRDSKLGDASPHLAFGPAAWRVFIAGLKEDRGA